MKSAVKISIIFLILISPTVCRSQSTGIQFGIEGGPGLSSVRYDRFFFPSKYLTVGIGGTVGLTCQLNLNKEFAVKTGLSYERKGYQNNSGSSRHRYDYLTLPVLIKYNFGKRPRLFVNIGPYIGYLLSESNKIEKVVDYDGDKIYHRVDLGISMGFGLEIPVCHRVGLTLEIRDNLGLYNIYKTGTYIHHGIPVQTGNPEYTGSMLMQIGFVYFPGKKKPGNQK